MDQVAKETTTSKIKEYYDNNDFYFTDIYDISKDTTKESNMFDYANIPNYLKTTNKSYDTEG